MEQNAEDAIVMIDVGGKIFKTTRATLQKSGHFRQHIAQLNATTPFFVNRSPKLFEHVLNLLRDSFYIYPEEYVSELDFYDLDIKVEYKANQATLTQRIDKITKKLDYCYFSLKLLRKLC